MVRNMRASNLESGTVYPRDNRPLIGYCSAMLTPDAFDEMVKDIAKLNGVSVEEAGRIACLIGDTPMLEEQGNVIVDGKIIRLEE